MQPYYQDDLVTIYHGDCREWMPDAEAVLTDPPYGELGYEWDQRPDWTTLPLPIVMWAVVFGHQPHLAREVLPALEARGLPFRFEWVWEKPIGRLWNHARPIRLHELAWAFGDTASGDLRRGFGGQHASVIAAPTYQAYMRAHPDATGHPTQKPLPLVAAILASLPTQSVLDPFMGSGTTLVAAKSLGVKALGVEMDERWCEVAAERCRQEALDLSFLPSSAARTAVSEPLGLGEDAA